MASAAPPVDLPAESGFAPNDGDEKADDGDASASPVVEGRTGEPWSAKERVQLMQLLRKYPGCCTTSDETSTEADRWVLVLTTLNKTLRKKHSKAYDAQLATLEAEKGRPLKKKEVAAQEDAWPEPIQRTLEELFAQIKPLHAEQVSKALKEERSNELYRVTCSRIDDLFVDHPMEVGKRAAQHARRQQRAFVHDEALMYGESDPKEFVRLLRALQLVHGHIQLGGGAFFDIGSGLAKPVFAAALFHPFRSCVGLERLEAVHQKATEIAEKYSEEALPTMSEAEQARREDSTVDLIHADALYDEEWSARWGREATIAYVDATLFDSKQWARVVDIAGTMHSGRVCISLTKKLPEADWMMLWEEEAFKTAWGHAPVYVQERRRGFFYESSDDEDDDGEPDDAALDDAFGDGDAFGEGALPVPDFTQERPSTTGGQRAKTVA